MTNVLTPPSIKTPALVAAASTDKEAALDLTPSREYEDALAGVNALLDAQETDRLRGLAGLLASFDLPAFDPDADHGAEWLDSVISTIDVLQPRLQNMAVVSGVNVRPTVNPHLMELRKVVQESARKLFEYSEELRWAVMNAQALKDSDVGKSRTFESAEAAFAYLMRKGQ